MDMEYECMGVQGNVDEPVEEEFEHSRRCIMLPTSSETND